MKNFIVQQSQNGYQNTELGFTPKDWQIKKIGELFNVQQGISMSPARRNGPNKHPFLRTLNVFWSGIDLSTLDYMDFSEREIEKLNLEPGDLLVCEGGDIGRTAMWRGELESCGYQNHLHRLRIKNTEVEPEFVMFWMQAAMEILGYYREEGNKTTIPNLSQSRLKNFNIPLPPLPEQHAIAATLRAVQEAKERNDAVIAATKALKAAMMKHLFTYGPVPPEEADRVALKETEIGQVPEGWDLQPLGNISKIASGGTPSRNEPTYWNGEIPWIRTGEINYSIIDRTEEKITKAGLENSSARIIPKGTLLMAMYGEGVTRGRVGITGIDASINQAVAAIFPSEKMLTQFLYYYLEFSYEKNRLLGHGAHQRNLSATIIKTILVPIPTEETQQHIVEILSFIDKKLAAEQSRKQALDTLFATLLHDLMTAKIRVKPIIV